MTEMIGTVIGFGAIAAGLLVLLVMAALPLLERLGGNR
jgi:hypothetical protein